MSGVGVGAQIEEAIKLARAVLIAGCPKSTVRTSIEVGGLFADVNIYSARSARGLTQRTLRRLRSPRTWLSYLIGIGARLGRKLDVADQNPWGYPFAIRCTVPVATPNCAAIL